MNQRNFSTMRLAAARSLWGFGLALALTASAQAASPSSAASAAPRAFGKAERQALEQGAMVSRPLRFEHGSGSYVGGVSYQVVDARPELVLAALSDVANWPEALPRTKSARLLAADHGVSRVELVQGGSFVEARYAVMLERAGDGETIRFWLDPTHPHDIRDVWGFFRVQALPDGRALITVAAALDLGEGLARMLFEDNIASMMLRAPSKIRAFVEPRALALGGAR
ncbi:MAG TPA: SRPBCC family protein [Polyangiaceae bacterium]